MDRGTSQWLLTSDVKDVVTGGGRGSPTHSSWCKTKVITRLRGFKLSDRNRDQTSKQINPHLLFPGTETNWGFFFSLWGNKNITFQNWLSAGFHRKNCCLHQSSRNSNEEQKSTEEEKFEDFTVSVPSHSPPSLPPSLPPCLLTPPSTSPPVLRVSLHTCVLISPPLYL